MTTKTLPRTRKSSIGKVDLSKEHEWLRQHKHEYVGQWVVLDGDHLVGHGSDPLPFFQQAKAEGVKMPFVHFIRDDSEPFCGGWL
jgi:Family of unknown function (DUF5678)